MDFIFAKLPLDLIKYIILPFDNHFKIRKSELVSIIPKDDKRYQQLETICLKIKKKLFVGNYHRVYQYTLSNLYNPPGRSDFGIDHDMMEIMIYEIPNSSIEYNVSISRFKPKENTNNTNINNDYICNYEWYYLSFTYIRS